MNMFLWRRLAMMAVGLGLLPGVHLLGQSVPLLLKEVVAREISVHVGGVQTPEHRDVASREVSVFIGMEPEPPLRQMVSREVSVVVTTPTVPARIPELVISMTATGDDVTLTWTGYNQWAEMDVARYDIYVSSTAFTNVAGMTPYAWVAGESRTLRISGLAPWQDRFFAVVPVDARGGYEPAVNYASAYILAREVVSREASMFVGEEPVPPQRQVVSRELSVVVTTPEVPARVTQLTATATPSGKTVALSWTGYNQWAERDVARYDIYLWTQGFTSVTGMTRYVSLPGETRSLTLDDLPLWRDHCFAVVPVDAAGGYDPTVQCATAYILAREVVSREMGVFIGGDPVPALREVLSRELSCVVATPEIPAPVTGMDSGFLANGSVRAYASLDLDWTLYNAWAQKDIVRYRIYLGPHYYDDVSAMEPYAYVPAEWARCTLGGLNPLGIYYVAVVAEDVRGQINPAVRSTSAQASIARLEEIRQLSVQCETNALHYSWQAPDRAAPFLAAYRVYFAGATEPQTLLPSESSFHATDLRAERGYPVRITTADIFGNESPGTSLLAATLLRHPVNVRVHGFDGMVRLTWDHVEPNDLVYKYGVYVAETNFTSVAGMTPAVITRARRADVTGLTNGRPYFFVVTTINIAGGESPDVVTTDAMPDPLTGDFADLRLTDFRAPAAAYPGRPILLGWRVVNEGPAATSAEDASPVTAWVDRVVLSSDDVLGNADDLALGDITRPAPLEPGADYTTNVTVAIPRLTPGEYHVFVITDADDAVFEGLDRHENEVMAALPLHLRLSVPPMDGEIAELEDIVLTNAPAATLPVGTLTFELALAPDGMTIQEHEGLIRWTPTETQGPSTNLVLVKATDHREPVLTETNQFLVTVREVNTAPVLMQPTDQTVDELATLTVQLEASDADLPTNGLRFALVSGPTGLTVTPAGALTWTPTEAQGPSTNTVVVTVTDNGTPALAATNQFPVTVREVNTAPVLVQPTDQTVDELATLTVQLEASDADLPANSLNFALVSGPSGLTVTPAGALTWTPTEAQGPSTNTVVVTVTDNGTPALAATNQFLVTVREVNTGPIMITQPAYVSGAFTMQVAIPAGRSFALEASTNLRDWRQVQAGQGTGEALLLTDTPDEHPNGTYYRIVLLP